MEDELITLRLRATLIEETEDNIQALTKALDVAVAEKDINVTEVKIEAEARGKAMAELKSSKEFVSALHKRYDGGWDAAMRCVCK